MELNALLKDMEQHLRSSPDAVLNLGWRLRLWDLINQQYPGEAILRRGALAFCVAQETLPAWDALEMPKELHELPRFLLKTCKQRLQDVISIQEAMSVRRAVWSGVETLAELFDDKGYGLNACLAAYATLNCVLSIEDAAYSEENVEYEGEPSLYAAVWIGEKHIQITDESCFDWEGWDTHKWASLVAASTGPSQVRKELNRNLLGTFWKNWLLEKVPLVLDNDITAINALFADPI